MQKETVEKVHKSAETLQILPPPFVSVSIKLCEPKYRVMIPLGKSFLLPHFNVWIICTVLMRWHHRTEEYSQCMKNVKEGGRCEWRSRAFDSH